MTIPTTTTLSRRLGLAVAGLTVVCGGMMLTGGLAGAERPGGSPSNVPVSGPSAQPESPAQPGLLLPAVTVRHTTVRPELPGQAGLLLPAVVTP